MSDSARDYLAAELTANVPAEWVVLPDRALPDSIDRTTVVLKATRIEKVPEAGLGTVRNTFIAGVFTALTDIAKAERQLDDDVLEVVTALDRHPTINWTDAVKVDLPRLGWDITLTVLSQPDDPTPAPAPTEE